MMEEPPIDSFEEFFERKKKAEKGGKSSNNGASEEPLPLFPPLAESEPFPTDSLGPTLSRAAKAIATKRKSLSQWRRNRFSPCRHLAQARTPMFSYHSARSGRCRSSL